MVSLQPRVYAQYVGPRCSELAKVSYLCVERKAGYPMGTENPAFLLAPEVTFQAIVTFTMRSANLLKVLKNETARFSIDSHFS